MTTTQSQTSDYRTWLRISSALIDQFEPRVAAGFAAGTLDGGVWHPNGFAVFPVTQTPLGRVRLHIWPEGERHGVDGHPPIHRHSWSMYSKIIAGTYHDGLYSVQDANATAGERHQEMAVYEVEYGSPKYTNDQIIETESRALVAPITHHRYRAGEHHEMPPGPFHSSPIPTDTFTATLMMMGDVVEGKRDTILGTPGWGDHSVTRQPVNEAQFAAMVEQFRFHRQLEGNDLGI